MNPSSYRLLNTGYIVVIEDGKPDRVWAPDDDNPAAGSSRGGKWIYGAAATSISKGAGIAAEVNDFELAKITAHIADALKKRVGQNGRHASSRSRRELLIGGQKGEKWTIQQALFKLPVTPSNFSDACKAVEKYNFSERRLITILLFGQTFADILLRY